MTPTSAPRRDFPKSERIAKRADFIAAYERGEKQFGRHVVVFALANELGHSRIGVTATKKVGKANVRNRLKRWTREVYRIGRAELELETRPCDFVVNVKNSAVSVSFDDFSADLLRAIRRLIRVR